MNNAEIITTDIPIYKSKLKFPFSDKPIWNF